MPPADAVFDPSEQPTQPVVLPDDVRAALCQRVDELNALAWDISENDPATARQQIGAIDLLLAQVAATSPPYLPGHANRLLVQAAVERTAGDYEASIRHSLEALALYQQLDHVDLWVFRAYYNLGLTYSRVGDYGLAEEANLRLYEMAETYGDLAMQAAALRNIGILHSRMNEMREALSYYSRCEVIYHQLDDLGGLASVYNNCCYEHYKLREYDLALEYGLKGLPLFAQTGSLTGQSRIHANLGLVYTALGQYATAEQHILRSVALAQEAQSTFSRLLSLQYLGVLRLKQGRSRDALTVTLSALRLAEHTKDRWEEADCCRQLAEIYERMGSLEQMAAYYKRYVQVRDTLFNEDNLVRLRGVETVWRTRQAQQEAETQRRLRQQERQQAARMIKMREDFLDAATHDLKNPLAIIAMAVAKLRRYVPEDNTSAHETFTRIEATVIEMRDLIANLLDLSPLETGYVLQPTPTDLVALAREALSSFHDLAEHKGIRLALGDAPPTLMMSLDSGRMRQALSNLLSNAVKYTPAGGSITLNISREGRDAVLTLRDTGIGIPPEALPHIFERFYRVRSPEHEGIDGSGLGLAITRSIIEQHGGGITAASVPGQGTTFTIRLPLARSAQVSTL